MTIETLSIDIAKTVFQLHEVNRNGRVILKRRVMRDRLLPVIAPDRAVHDRYRSLHRRVLLATEVRGDRAPGKDRQPTIREAVRTKSALKTIPVAPAGSGTVSPTMSAARSWTWPSMSRSCRLGNWRLGSPTQRGILSRKPRSIGCSRPKTWSPARPSSSSRQPMSSATRPRPRTNCGRPTSPASRSSAGLVLSVDDPRRLFPLHHRLEAVHDHEGRRCDGAA